MTSLSTHQKDQTDKARAVGAESLGASAGTNHGNYYIVYWEYIGIMEKKMETTIVYWDYIL